ncbi:MAG: penicillin-binding protein 2 [Ruminococcus sp.]|nr:penicillin-binding protein 2 [Ruminococcus sp.]
MHGASLKIIMTAAFSAAAGVGLLCRLLYINFNRDYYMSFDMSAPREVTVVCSYGDILDRNGIPLVNTAESYVAVIDPASADKAALSPHITDREKYDSCINGGALFLCGVDTDGIDGVPVITVKERYSEDSMCRHIIGYLSGGEGAGGLEKSFNDILRQPSSTVTLRYSADAAGNFLAGNGVAMRRSVSYVTGICISVDYEIQAACEAAMKNIEKGAAVVMDISTGELCAVVSKPDFDPRCVEKSLDSEDAPFINRAFSAYSVGSAFKLVTAGAALEYGVSEDYPYECTGSITVRENKFGCHRFGGHGLLDMRSAMTESCNPYFISLGRDIPTDRLYEFAQKAGFGRETRLASGIISAAGHLTTENELAVPEEKANFSFGQGKLTATPLQITMLTAAIANGGQMPKPVLIRGSVDLTSDHTAVSAAPAFERIMKKSVADKLRSFMISALYKENSAAVPEFTTGGGKTSTAQTWTYNEYGAENLNCWFTGFFPADEPRYAVTVMAEEGVSGNLTCGPVFKEIADSVKMKRYAEDGK